MEHEDETKINVGIEYCSVCNYKNHCLDLAKQVLENVPNAKVACTIGRRGSFEVTVNDILVHSKLASMALPDYNDVIETVKNAKEGKQIQKVKEQPITDCAVM